MLSPISQQMMTMTFCLKEGWKPMTTILLNILLGLYSALCVTFLISMIQSIRGDRKRAKRDEEREARDKEYHEKRMRDFK